MGGGRRPPVAELPVPGQWLLCPPPSLPQDASPSGQGSPARPCSGAFSQNLSLTPPQIPDLLKGGLPGLGRSRSLRAGHSVALTSRGAESPRMGEKRGCPSPPRAFLPGGPWLPPGSTDGVRAKLPAEQTPRSRCVCPPEFTGPVFLSTRGCARACRAGAPSATTTPAPPGVRRGLTKLLRLAASPWAHLTLLL